MHKILKRVSLWKNILYVQERLKRLAWKVYANILHCGFSLTFVCVYLGEPSQKKPTFFADISAKAFSPPPGLSEHTRKNVIFFLHVQILFISKQFQKCLIFSHNKSLRFLSGQGFSPPPLTDMSASNFFFLYGFPYFDFPKFPFTF